MSATLQDIEEFFTKFRALRSQVHERCTRVPHEFFRQARLLSDKLRKERMRTAERFNLFELIGLQDSEALHSKFIAGLLDPQGRHDQGSLFLRSFLGQIGLEDIAQLEDEGIPTWVVTEWPTPNGRIDIIVFLGHSAVVCIENKVWATEQKDQIGRYQCWLAGFSQHTKSRCVVFLTPDGRPPGTAAPCTAPEASVRVHQMSYRDVATWIGSLEQQVPAAIAVVLRMYASICRQIGANSELKGYGRSMVGGNEYDRN
jgi:hypothetical protein